MTKNKKVTLYIVWIYDEDNNQWLPVTAADNEDEAAEYVYERENEYEAQYTITTCRAVRPTESPEPREDEEEDEE